MFMEHEEGLFLFAEQTSVVPMCMIIMRILVNIKCVVICCECCLSTSVPCVYVL